MKFHTRKHSQEVTAQIGEVSPCFATPKKLERMTSDALRVEVITPGGLEMKHGALFDYLIRMRGLPMRWTTYLAECDASHRFVDVQLKGPYSFWHHTHTFEPTPNGNLIQDEVRSGMPFGLVGALAHALVFRKDLDLVFSCRRDIIREIFGAVSAPTGRT